MVQLPLVVLVTGKSIISVERKLNAIGNFAGDVDIDLILEKNRDLNYEDEFRGFLIICNGIVASKKISRIHRRPLVFFMGSISTEWLGMGTVLMSIRQFKDSVEKCAKILGQHGFDLMARFYSTDHEFAFGNDLVKFIQVSVIQIALVDLLQAANVKYDYSVGYSLGEHCALYLNGCTVEQSLMSVFMRGKALEDEGAQLGFLGIMHGYGNDKPLPGDVRRVAYLLPGTCLYGGRQRDIPDLTKLAEREGAILQVVYTEIYVHHHTGLAPFSDDLFRKYELLLGEGIPRSPRWISSVFAENSKDPRSMRGDAFYVRCIHTMPLLFDESLRQVPKDAVIVSLDPSRLFAEVVDAIIGPSIQVVTLMKRDTSESEALLLLFESLATLFLEGQDVNLKDIYGN